MSPEKFSPQSASGIDVEQSEAASTGVKHVISAISAKADNHVVYLLFSTETPIDGKSSGRSALHLAVGNHRHFQANDRFIVPCAGSARVASIKTNIARSNARVKSNALGPTGDQHDRWSFKAFKYR
jgi:hypothetical protein